MNNRNHSFYSGGVLILLAVLFITLTILSSVFLKGMRFDLTENQLYTLSDGTRSILENMDEPVDLQLSGSIQSPVGLSDTVQSRFRPLGVNETVTTANFPETGPRCNQGGDFRHISILEQSRNHLGSAAVTNLDPLLHDVQGS